MSTNDTSIIEKSSLSYSIKFVVLLALQIPSILLSLIIFAHFATSRMACMKDHNHAVIVLLVINFVQVLTDFPIPMSFFHLDGLVRPATAAYCIWWIWYEFSLNNMNAFLMAWISIERHILIFHSHLIRGIGTWKRWSLHVAPLIICSVWGPLLYIVMVVFSPMCSNKWVFNRLFCGLPCYLSSKWGAFDFFLNIIFPIAVISISNITFIIRVVYQKVIVVRRPEIQWRRQRKMVLQLGLICTAYLAVWIPVSIMQLCQIYIDPMFLFEESDIINFVIYFIPLVLPAICIISMPELLKRLKTKLCRKPHTTVGPITVAYRATLVSK